MKFEKIKNSTKEKTDQGGKVSKLKLSGKHILLLLFYSPGGSDEINEPLSGRTRIIKMMYLFKEEVKKRFLKDTDIDDIQMQEFYAWDYGPFSKDVYNDIEFFINNGFVRDNRLGAEMSGIEIEEFEKLIDDFSFEYEKELLLSDRNEYTYRLTDKGKEFTKNIWDKLTVNQRKVLKKFKNSIIKSTLHGLVRYVYMKYPKMIKKSKIKDKIIG